MKKYIFGLISLMALVLASCSKEEGVVPGGDSNPCVTLYQLPVSMPLNADNDACVRVCANSQVTEAYYKVFTAEEYEAVKGNAGLGAQIKETGSKVELQADSVYGGLCGDVVVQDMQGEVVIAFAGVSGSNIYVATENFKGLSWEDVCSGTYIFGSSFAGIADHFAEPRAAVLQKCVNEEGLYRIKDLFGEGYSHKIYTTGIKDSDEDGDFEYVYVPGSPTPFTYGNYGMVSVRDVYSWQSNNNSYLVDVMYDDYYIQIWSQYYVSAGSLGYGWEYFVPAE